jgi:hypothetical protein
LASTGGYAVPLIIFSAWGRARKNGCPWLSRLDTGKGALSSRIESEKLPLRLWVWSGLRQIGLRGLGARGPDVTGGTSLAEVTGTGCGPLERSERRDPLFGPLEGREQEIACTLWTLVVEPGIS